jgi:hypothetical protein
MKWTISDKFSLLSLFDTMLNFVDNLLENERDSRSGPMNDQDHSLSLSDPDRSLVLSHFLTNFLQNLASCHTAFKYKNIGNFHPFDFTSKRHLRRINLCEGYSTFFSKFISEWSCINYLGKKYRAFKWNPGLGRRWNRQLLCFFKA